MRFINLRDLVLPDGWKAKAEAARQAVEQAAPEERRKAIDAHSEMWKSLKSAFGALSQGKCWYSEAKIIGSDRDVDHFRPKGAVHGTDHPGYWWLAFDKDNFRYSCNFCNRRRTDNVTGHTGGKHDRFPLCDEKARAKQPTDDITQEQPLLLDPCVAADPLLLTFAENGEAVPRHSEKDRPRMHQRAKTSIEIYHLNVFAPGVPGL